MKDETQRILFIAQTYFDPKYIIGGVAWVAQSAIANLPTLRQGAWTVGFSLNVFGTGIP